MSSTPSSSRRVLATRLYEMTDDPGMGDIPKLAPAEARPELHSVVKQAEGGFFRKAKDAVTP